MDEIEYDKWIRLSGTFTPTSDSKMAVFQITTPFGVGANIPYDDGFYMWGAQLEVGDTLSSYTEQDFDPGYCVTAEAGKSRTHKIL